ncbi:AAA family ATPase [Absiella sp. AM54-8XD]|uniref:ATP-binding protein n=1 Tax=Erysipelotrichaceae TaxID=128827 RepID=UPI000E417D8B|nr:MULTISPECIES: RNA-binding domain-containing protein [unclassified Absiella]RGC25701.1 AAA family ATPase [Absiella sp. AM54-8XD]RGC53407.1 AAA family ATPase [Absiella sp. AM29-15]
MFQIEKFYEYRENNRYEVKKAKNGLPQSLWETYSSFANSNGGVIILGVEENKNGSWHASGLADSSKLLKEFWNIINNRQKVSMNLLRDDDIEIYEQDGNIIMVIYIPKAGRDERPIYINGDMFKGTYRRNYEGDYRCTKDEVMAMLRDQPEETMDMKVLDYFDIDVLNEDTIKAYRNRHILLSHHHPWEKLEKDEYLQRIGAIAETRNDKKLHPTAAGLLMFGEEYCIVREFPEYFLDYQELLDPTIRWTDRMHSNSGDWTGNLFDFYFRVYHKLTKDVKVPFQIEHGNRIDDTMVHKAIREALANCIINTDYYGKRGIVIKKSSDQIIIENPGDIRTGKQQMIRGGISDPRNKLLMKMFNLIKIGERAGSGVPDIFQVWENENFDTPMIEEQFHPNRTILTLPLSKRNVTIKSDDKKVTIKSGDKRKKTVFTDDSTMLIKETETEYHVPKEKSDDKKVTIKKDVTSKTQTYQQAILDYMETGLEYRLIEFCELLSLKETRVKVLMKALIESGKVETLGANRNRRYKRKS